MVAFVRRVFRAIFPDLRGKIAALSDTDLLRLRDEIYRYPRGLKGYHIRMVTDEIARRGL